MNPVYFIVTKYQCITPKTLKVMDTRNKNPSERSFFHIRPLATDYIFRVPQQLVAPSAGKKDNSEKTSILSKPFFTYEKVCCAAEIFENLASRSIEPLKKMMFQILVILSKRFSAKFVSSMLFITKNYYRINGVTAESLAPSETLRCLYTRTSTCVGVRFGFGYKY